MNSGYTCLAFLMIVLALGLGACKGEAERAGWQVYESEAAGDTRGPR